MAQGYFEGQHEGGLYAESFNGGEALGEVLNETGGVFRCEHLSGVLGKSHTQRSCLELMRIGNGLPKDLLMTEMDAVEEAEGAADAADGGLNYAGVEERPHSAGRNMRAISSSETIRAGNASAGNLTRSSRRVASATLNLPDWVRWRALKCAPHSRCCPSSCARLRT